MMMLWLAEVLRDAGLEVVEKPGWETRGRDSMKPGGVVCHHTGGVSDNDASYADFLIRGRADLPGPLSQLFLDQRGRWWVLAAGKANHAGSGGWKGLVGNSSVIGVEAEHAGTASVGWPDVQLQSYKTGVAALLKKIGRNADWCCGHKEWAPGRKIDPAGIDMNTFRADVGRILADTTTNIPADRLTPDEVRKLRALIAAWESVGSNPSFPKYTIQHVRDSR